MQDNPFQLPTARSEGTPAPGGAAPGSPVVPADSAVASGGELHRTLGFWALMIYGVGDILGAGIYALVGKIAGVAGAAAWASFLVAMGVAALTALSYAELGSRFPRSGGASYFCHTAFRRNWPALLIGWFVLCSGLVSMAAGSHAFAGYLQQFGVLQRASWPLIVAFLLMLATINFLGMRLSSAANILCTALEVTGLLIVIVAGAVFFARGGAAPAAAAPAAGADWLAILQGGALAFFAFIGFEDLVNVSEEVENPSRNVPLAIIAALAVAGVVYITVVVIAVSVVPVAILAKSKGPLLEVVRLAAPIVPPVLFTVIALFAVSNTALLNYVMGSRLLYGMSRQHLLPGVVGRVHRTRRTPYVAIVLVFMIALCLALYGTLSSLAGTTSFLLLGVFCIVHVALITVKLRDEEPAAGFRIPTVIPALGAVASLALMFYVPRPSLMIAAAIVVVGLLIIAVHWAVTRSVPSATALDEPDLP